MLVVAWLYCFMPSAVVMRIRAPSPMRLLLTPISFSRIQWLPFCDGVVEVLDPAIQHVDDAVDPAVVVEVAERETAVRGGLLKIGAGVGY